MILRVRPLLLLVLCLMTPVAATYAQEICDNGFDDDGDGLIDLNDTTDCNCPLVDVVQSLFENPSFDFFDNDDNCASNQVNGAPDGPGQADCLSSWSQASDATTDAWHLLTYNGNPPNWPGSVPQPIPSGLGAAGFFVGVSGIPEYREYLGACLPPGTIQAGTEYRLDFYLGFGEDTGNGIDTIIYSPEPVELAVYGILACDQLRFIGRECPERVGAEGWELITTVNLNGTAPGWENHVIDFIPDENYAAIAVGGSCAEVSGPDGFVFWRRYYFIDELRLNTREVFETTTTVGPVSVLGDDICDPTAAMQARQFPGATYQWYRNGVAIAGATDNTYYPPLDGNFTASYSVRINRPEGCGVAGPVDLIRPIVRNAFADSVRLCPDGTALISPTLNENLVQEYRWDDGSTQAERRVTAAGNYAVTITSFCEETVENITVVEDVEPTFEIATDPAEFCVGDVVRVYFVTDWQLNIFGTGPGLSRTFRIGDTALLIATEEPNQVNVFVVGNCGTNSNTAYFFPAKKILDGIPEIGRLSCTNTSVTIDPPTVGSAGDYSYQWTDAAGTVLGTDSTLTVSVEGSYFLSIEDSAIGCTEEAEYTVINDPDDSPFTNFIQQNPSCFEPTGSISVDLNLPPGASLEWTNTEGEVIGDSSYLEVLDAGIYTLTAYVLSPGGDTVCAPARNWEITTTFAGQNLADIEEANDISCFDPNGNILVTTYSSNTRLAWYDEDRNFLSNASNLVVDSLGNYLLTAFVLNERNDTVCREALEQAINLQTGIDFGFSLDSPDPCSGLAGATIVPPEPAEDWTVSWLREGGAVFATAVDRVEDLSPGRYVGRVVKDELCRDEIVFSVPDFDSLRLSARVEVAECPTVDDPDANVRVVLEPSAGVGPYLYTLEGIGGNATGVFSGLPEGDYSGTVVDVNGCTAVSNAVTLTLPPLLIAEAGEDVRIDLGDSLRLNTSTNNPPLNFTGPVWSPADGLSCTECPEPSARPVRSTTYTVSYLTEDGCVVTDSVRVGVVTTGLVYAPTAFSPNQDGVNDRFLLFPDRSVAALTEFRVFDRWGGMVYDGELNRNGNDGWDGNYPSGRTCDAGVYLYVARAQLLNGEVRQLSGTVTLLRK